MAETLVVGPRQLPGSGLVRVWIDSGSGGGSYIKVRREQLAPAEMAPAKVRPQSTGFARRTGQRLRHRPLTGSRDDLATLLTSRRRRVPHLAAALRVG
ncbi:MULTISPECIES: hypothetical protein [unclassified Solwaraspora]|uniref:hypothetical protein n=1 Tax=unclassified Solwaraspora TaxID=2627926 RepID=UPI00259B328C|nr:hypothetical protein [Solwaraspora sp. WMMA2056]WJK43135.1 hypothetical protein O7608_12505 [Solwaraspora sp. WMMA2056]